MSRGARARRVEAGRASAWGVRLPGVALVALLALPLTACSPFDDLMVAVFGRSMRDQPSFDPYENPMPPPGSSVPFAAGNYPAGPFEMNVGQPEGLSAEDMPPPFGQQDLTTPLVQDLRNRVPPTARSLERGREVYERFCAPCHGVGGLGAEAPLASIHPTVEIYDLSGETVQAYTDGYIYGLIRVGRALMPPYGHRISHWDRWHVVNYVRRLQGLVPEGGVEAPEEAAGPTADTPAGAGTVDTTGAAGQGGSDG